MKRSDRVRTPAGGDPVRFLPFHVTAAVFGSTYPERIREGNPGAASLRARQLDWWKDVFDLRTRRFHPGRQAQVRA